MTHFFRFCLIGLLINCCSATLYAQPQLQDAGSICCDQNLCPSDSFPLIEELTDTTPPDSLLNLEYSWYSLVTDTTTPSGTKWVKLSNTNSKTYTPTTLGTPFGGFFMRAVREVGTLPYLFSNVVSYVPLGANNPECISTSKEEYQSAILTVYPNPAQRILQIQSASDAFILQYRIRSSAGILVVDHTTTPEFATSINIDWLPKGFYTLEIILSDGKRSIHQWIKM